MMTANTQKGTLPQLLHPLRWVCRERATLSDKARGLVLEPSGEKQVHIAILQPQQKTSFNARFSDCSPSRIDAGCSYRLLDPQHSAKDSSPP